jgi:hemerythrin
MFDWKGEYATGIKSIDSQHQNLFAIGRELYAAMSTGKANNQLASILDRLVQYTAAHFAHEESLMRMHQYPNFDKHKADHDALVKQVVAFQVDFKSGRIAMAIDVLHFLRDWLAKHIQGTDFAYIPFMKEKKVA